MLYLHLGEHGQSERGNAEMVEGPQHQGLLLLHPGETPLNSILRQLKHPLHQTPDFVGGSKACMTLAGLGKLSPNMVLMGFKNNWKQDLVGLHQYMDVMYAAFDLRLSFAILRCKEGLDFSSQV